MKQVNFNKNMQEAYSAYKSSAMYSLYDCYNNYSEEKSKAYDYCQSLLISFSKPGMTTGALKILSYNIFQFTAGFVYTDLDNKKHFVRITKTQDLDCILPEGF